MSETTSDEQMATDDQTTTEERSGRPGHEAAKYRTRLRAAEAQRDALAVRMEAMQRREVERLASKHLAQPGDLFEVGRVDLAAMLDETGDVSADAVHAAAESLVESRPGLAVARRGPSFDGGARTAAKRAASWADVLSRGVR